jgi:hypothetical protein
VSKHTWDRKPTPGRAAVVLDAYLYAVARDGRAPATAFAGYVAERAAQASAGQRRYNPRTGAVLPYNRKPAELWGGAVRSGHRYAKGKNLTNYHRVWQNHATLMLPLATARLAPLAGLAPDAPWYAVADALRDANLDALAGALVVLAAAVEGSGPAS